MQLYIFQPCFRFQKHSWLIMKNFTEHIIINTDVKTLTEQWKILPPPTATFPGIKPIIDHLLWNNHFFTPVASLTRFRGYELNPEVLPYPALYLNNLHMTYFSTKFNWKTIIVSSEELKNCGLNWMEIQVHMIHKNYVIHRLQKCKEYYLLSQSSRLQRLSL